MPSQLGISMVILLLNLYNSCTEVIIGTQSLCKALKIFVIGHTALTLKMNDLVHYTHRCSCYWCYARQELWDFFVSREMEGRWTWVHTLVGGNGWKFYVAKGPCALPSSPCSVWYCYARHERAFDTYSAGCTLDRIFFFALSRQNSVVSGDDALISLSFRPLRQRGLLEWKERRVSES